MEQKIKCLEAELQKMYGIELLEYHDKNYLSGDNQTRSIDRQKQLLYSMELLCKIKSALLTKAEECQNFCGINYCDENGCINKKQQYTDHVVKSGPCS